MCEQALFIYKHASQVEGTNMAKCSAYNEQSWVLQVPAAGLCMQEAIGDLLQLAKQVAKGITRSAFGLKTCSCVSLLLCSMTQPFNAGIV